MTRASGVPFPKWFVSLVLGPLIVLIGACASSGTGADRDSGAKAPVSSSQGATVCGAGEPGQAGQAGQPGVAESGRGPNAQPGQAEAGQPGQPGQPGEPGSCVTR
jgi:hypothetical protein